MLVQPVVVSLSLNPIVRKVNLAARVKAVVQLCAHPRIAFLVEVHSRNVVYICDQHEATNIKLSLLIEEGLDVLLHNKRAEGSVGHRELGRDVLEQLLRVLADPVPVCPMRVLPRFDNPEFLRLLVFLQKDGEVRIGETRHMQRKGDLVENVPPLRNEVFGQ